MSSPVYVVVQMTIADRDTFTSDYGKPVMAQLEGLGARIVAATGTPRVVEGRYDRNNTAVIEFPSAEAFDAWYGSEAYAPLKARRLALTEPDTALMMVLPAFPAASA
ncbi:MAG: DUF1330 domain-containing protein [Pseudomonadota bacterium]